MANLQFTPKLHSRYIPVRAMPLDQWLQHNTTHLERWLHCLKHQLKMSWSLLNNKSKGEITLAQAFHTMKDDASW
ncbi:MAG: hypothetical protein ACK53Y_11420, partial [bacterium]